MRKNRSRSKKSETYKYLGSIVLTAITIFFVAGVIYYQYSRPKPLTENTMCPANGPLGHVVLLVDKTDPFNITQRKSLQISLNEIISTRIPEGYLLSIFVLGENFEQSTQPVIELCNPGSDAGKSELDNNLSRLRKKYEDRFIKPLDEISKSLITDESAKNSPIFEMLQHVGISGFRKNSVHGPKKLIIFSDMLHNTPQYSMFRGVLSFEEFSALDYSKKVTTDLSQVDVEINYLLTNPKLQTRRNSLFWEEYFRKIQSRVVQVNTVEG